MNNIVKIREVKRQHEGAWIILPGVLAIGIGITASGETGIIVSTSGDVNALRKQIPERVEEIPVELRYSGPILAQ